MRVLLDNCVNFRFGYLLVGHDVSHARRLGWDELSNGRLLAAGESAGFHALVTVDKSIDSQQSLADRRICLVTLDVRSITLDGRRPMVGTTLDALRRIEEEDLQGESLLLHLRT